MAPKTPPLITTLIFLHTLLLTTTTTITATSSGGDFLSPLLSPVIGDLCKSVGCGKGKCIIPSSSDQNHSITDFFPLYECQCDPGWKQTLFSPHNNNSAPTSSSNSTLKFLPCVIPNCTLHSSCSNSDSTTPSPPPPPPPSSKDIFDPCNWANCGNGLCNRTSTLTFSCQCKEGYYNLFNNTGFPCFRECSIGGDCPNLGIPISNKSSTTTTSAPNLPDSSNGCSQHGFVVLVLSSLVFNLF